jgi:hypothetical protein
MVAEILDRFTALEECYEFMLAYAAQGLPSDVGNESGRQVRKFLRRAVEALDGLVSSCEIAMPREDRTDRDRFAAFLTVLDGDARHSLAALELVLAEPVISSQLIDNLNASMHVRALLTDTFLLGDILRTQRAAANQMAAAVTVTSGQDDARGFVAKIQKGSQRSD